MLNIKLMRHQQRCSHRQRGVALIEALIALLIFSLGILGMIGLQAIAIRQTTDAKNRSDAAYLANQIISQMWVDRSAIATYALQTTGTPSSSSCTFSGGSGNTNVQAWQQLVNGTSSVPSMLPSSTSSQQQIVVTSSGGTYFVKVTLCWKQPQETEWHNYTATAQINI